MEKEDILNQMSGDHSGSNRDGTTIDDPTINLPEYLSYFTFGFRLISAVIIIVMAGWIIITIKTTRSLKKIHNIFIAHLMATDAIYVLIRLVFNGIILVSGEGYISCHVSYFFLFPLNVVSFTYVTISVDKVIAITFPLRYRQIMSPRVAVTMITTKWLLAIALYSHNLFNPNGFTKTAKFGICGLKDGVSPGHAISIALPIFLACSLAIILNIYLTIKAYKVHKQIQEESRLSGGHTDHLEALKKKQATIKKHRKPMITLIVAVATSFIGVLFALMLLPLVFLESPAFYQDIMQYVVGPNISYFSFLFHPFVYGLYFKQVREPMMRLLKRISRLCRCKSAFIAPQRRITWMNPN